MPESDITEHHCVPHSFDGAATRVNLSKVTQAEHNSFHQMTGHSPPDFFLRRFLIGSVGWMDQKGRSLSPSLYQDVLSILTPNDWRDLYQTGTFIVPHGRDQGEALRKAKAAFHVAWYLDREMSLIMDQIGLLGIHKLPPYGTVQEMQGIHHFFGKDRPHVLMRTFLLDGQDAGELKWVKSLREDVRQELLTVLRTTKLERLTSNGSSQRIFDLLLDHHSRLVECTKNWQPNLRNHAVTLKQMLSERLQ
ncbi:MAG: hypothetical protein PHE68_00740 [Candidatus Peribacteraceae bacterium]|nr:hypothetical protein [Candidatus Peribacteraceae bacterium]MDD5074323.1 hypothetical protein [Candidatus Peribacteraceae bacterium]